MPQNQLDLVRFRKVCGMLGSSHDGERSAAALKATAILKDAGLTWHDIAIGQAKATNAPPPEQPKERPSAAKWWQDLAINIMGADWGMTSKEWKFIEDMSDWDNEPSEKQTAWLMRLATRAGVVR